MKVMIVDDMPIYREYLREFIDWNAYGLDVCCEAKDGREALELYEIYQPDIVLTDIVMPYLDGLELSEELLNENPDLSIILITGNSEFEYARKAVKLGICDYIVKPFEKEELIIALLKLQDNINRVLELRNEQDQIDEEDTEQQLWQYIYKKNIKNNISQLPKIFKYSYFLVVTIHIELIDNNVKSEEILKWKQVLYTMLNNMIQINGTKEIFRDYEGNIVTILNFSDKESMEEYQYYEFEDICKLTKQRIGFDVSIGISDYCYSSEHLSDAYYETIKALSDSYVEHNTKIFDYKKMVTSDDILEFYSWDLIEDINNCLEVSNYERIEILIHQELDRIKEYENTEYAVMIYMSLLSILFSFLVKKGRNIDDVLGKEFHPSTVINKNVSYKIKRNYICECYKKATTYQQKHIDTKSRKIAENARIYIEKHYVNPDLSIADISRELLVNQTYLRRMFKDEFSMTISDFITKCRMEKAKERIENENCKLSYIAYQVGYNDASYFSKCFKKYYGYLPSEIIKKNKF
ncbi:MAG: response regulator [Anaerolineaceae bacterium]|nr:MAG: response regulator [Anaerolineaceae bacterium]